MHFLQLIRWESFFFKNTLIVRRKCSVWCINVESNFAIKNEIKSSDTVPFIRSTNLLTGKKCFQNRNPYEKSKQPGTNEIHYTKLFHSKNANKHKQTHTHIPYTMDCRWFCLLPFISTFDSYFSTTKSNFSFWQKYKFIFLSFSIVKRECFTNPVCRRSSFVQRKKKQLEKFDKYLRIISVFLSCKSTNNPRTILTFTSLLNRRHFFSIHFQLLVVFFFILLSFGIEKASSFAPLLDLNECKPTTS